MKNDFNGKITVNEQAEYLSKHGHLMVRTDEDNSLHFIKKAVLQIAKQPFFNQ